MSKTANISTRINATDKKRAEVVFKELGISASQAISLFYKQVYLRRGIPFPIELPNVETIKAIEDAEAGRVNRYDSVEALKSKLSA